MACHLAGVRLEHPLDLPDGARLLVQQHLAGHRRDVRVAQLHRDPETVAQPHQGVRVGGKGRLSGPDEHDTTVELSLDRLGDLGDGGRAVLDLVDVLLDFVQNQHRQWQCFIIGQGPFWPSR